MKEVDFSYIHSCAERAWRLGDRIVILDIPKGGKYPVVVSSVNTLGELKSVIAESLNSVVIPLINVPYYKMTQDQIDDLSITSCIVAAVKMHLTSCNEYLKKESEEYNKFKSGDVKDLDNDKIDKFIDLIKDNEKDKIKLVFQRNHLDNTLDFACSSESVILNILNTVCISRYSLTNDQGAIKLTIESELSNDDINKIDSITESMGVSIRELTDGMNLVNSGIKSLLKNEDK